MKRQVPSELAVVGVDNDETLCDVCNPPLSSVDPGHHLVGYRAASMLKDMMAGQAPTPFTYLEPQGIVVRASSEIIATEDRLVAADVVSHFPVSRSVIQRRFRQETGCSIHDAILRTRLQRARQLLGETGLSLMEVAMGRLKF